MPDTYYGNQQTPSSQPSKAWADEGAAAGATQPADRAADAQPNGSQPADAAAPAAQGEPAAQTSPVPQADTSGLDATLEVPVDGRFDSVNASEPTESFRSARGGDTGQMPGSQAAYSPQAQQAQPSYGQQAPNSGAAPAAGAAASAFAAQPSSGQVPYGAGQPAMGQAPYGAGQPAPYAAYTQQNATQQPQQPAAASRKARKAAKQKAQGGGGKTFLLGFLGALLACALGLGGFVAYDQTAGNRAGSTSEAATVLLGTSDSSVIDAVEEGQSLAEAVAAKALPSVVAVYNYQKPQASGGIFGYGYGRGQGQGSSDELQAAGMGSGVVISQDGYILTNYHVVEDADKLTVTVDGAERDAEYVGGDSSADVAVVKVEDTSGLVAADIGDSDSLKIGEWVMTVGAPLGLEQSVATGVVSATNRSTFMDNSSSEGYGLFSSNETPEYTYYPNMIQTDAVINPGNSGGALVDADGKLVGINSMLSSYTGNYAGVGFAIPVNYAMALAEDIIAGKEPSHAALGVSISQVNAQIAQRYNLSADEGAFISDIVPGSGAADSDLQVGDIITAINGKDVTSTTDVTLDVREHAVGDTVTVTVNRDGESLDVEVKLSADTDLTYSSSSDEQQEPEGRDGRGDRDQGDGSGLLDGYSQEEIEQIRELLDLFGM